MPYESFRFGAYTLDTARVTLSADGASIALRPKSYALLEYLVRHPGRLLGKDELLAAVWAGVVVTDDSLTRCISEIRAALGDNTQQIVKTVPRRGYLFAAPVVAEGDDAIADVASAPLSKTRRRAGWALPLAMLSALLLGAAAWAMLGGTSTPAPPLSVAVLPFDSVSGSDAPPGWGSALNDEVTGALKRLRGVRVVSASGADVSRIGRTAGVRYAVKVNVQRDDPQFRVGVQLLDAETVELLWSDQFDVGAGAAAQERNDAVLRLASALDVQLLRADAARTSGLPAAALGADDLAVQCIVAGRARTQQPADAGLVLCEQALQKDPHNVRALTRLALHLADRVSAGQTSDPAADLDRAAAYTALALAADPEYAAAHCAHAMVLEGRRRVPDAVVEAERCLALNPGDASAHWLLAVETFFLHRPDQTLAHAERGMKLEPRDPRLSGFLLFRGWALLQLDRNDEALTSLQRAQAAAPEAPPISLALTVALVESGRVGDARAEMARYMSLPRTQARTISQWSHRPDGNAAFATFDARVHEALQIAGMPP